MHFFFNKDLYVVMLSYLNFIHVDFIKLCMNLINGIRPWLNLFVIRSW